MADESPQEPPAPTPQSPGAEPGSLGHSGLIRDEATTAASRGNAPVAALVVTSKRVWLAIAGLGFVIAAIILWGFFGAIPTVVQGGGILLSGRDLYVVEVFTPARITSLDVGIGDRVEVGDVVATLEETSLDAQYDAAARELTSLRQQNKLLDEAEKLQISVSLSTLKTRRTALNVVAEKSRNLFVQQQQQVRVQAELFAEGLIAESTYLATQQEAALLEEKMFTAEAELVTAEATFSDIILQIETAQDARETDIVIAEGTVSTLRTKKERELILRSPVTGRVVEVRSQNKTVVQAGFPLIEIAVEHGDGGELYMIGYVPLHMGKRVKVGMSAQVAPSIAKRDRYGYIYGTVESVSEYPVSLAVMVEDLQNEILVSQFQMVIGPALRVRVKLETDSKTISGFRWSTEVGYPAPLTPGTESTLGIVVEETRPIDLLVPWFRNVFGL